MNKLMMGIAALSLVGITSARSQSVDTVEFQLSPNPAFKQCLGPNPQADVKVTRGKLADTLRISFSGLNPNLDFDLFTIQRTNLDGSGVVDPSFKGFGLSWYQTDLHSNEQGRGRAEVHTILLDQIFGFDADAITITDGTTTTPTTRVPPTNTFHVGFWFNNPQDAVACGFNASKPTPFNGEHKAGPNAMISLPVAPNNLGPLCTSPTGISPDDAAKDDSGLTFICNP